MCGHLYSLYVPTKNERTKPIIGWETPIRSFAAEVERIAPEAMFFLGDNTRFSVDEEWIFLQSIFASVDTPKIFAPGNHEYRDISVFQKYGGLINRSVIIGRNKYIVIDAKSILARSDIDFIEREVADYEDYDNVFIMMHLFLPVRLAPRKEVGADGTVHYFRKQEPQEEIDPYSPYSGVSNWSFEVVPLIAGKVKYVFVGDHQPLHTVRLVQDYGEHQIEYIRNGFRFGRGNAVDSTGDGPMVFLELRFEGASFSIIPRAVPLDLKDPWYQDFRKTSDVPDIQEPTQKR